MAAPTIPQRPARSQIAPPQAAGLDVPHIPPRPNRNVNRSVSPGRDRYARSPLNDPAFLQHKTHGSSGLSRQVSRELPARPPSVDFPGVGEEGFEYGHIPSSNTATNVAGDLPLHAPKASLHPVTARSKIAQVTRTDSNQAAAAGIGRPSSESGDTKDRRHSSSQPSTSRPQSIYGKEHDEVAQGIPEIGVQIPLYKNAGDVQAPTPTPSAQGRGGFAPPGSAPLAGGRHHNRTKSGREMFAGPPGSYGMHGHGKRPTDALEAEWYQKHPDELAREAKGEYGPAISDNRKEWTLSSEELNRLVHSNLSLPAMGGSPAMIGTPDEQIGYMASEVYSSRLNSPRSTSSPRRPSSLTHEKSSLRKMSVASEDADDDAVESEGEHLADTIVIEPPSRVGGKYTGAGYDPPTQDLGPNGGNTDGRGGFVTEDGYGTPILASDEVSHRREAQLSQPAIEPEQERRGSQYASDSEQGNGRSGSRPSSIHSQNNLSRFASYEARDHAGTPLDNVKEYEPLFPESDDDEKTTQKKYLALKKKRPDLARHHFPSKDIWEDTPESSMYETTVGTPQLPHRGGRAAEHEPDEYFETPEQEQARKDNITTADQQNFLPEHTKKLAKTRLNASVLSDMPTRPGLRHRFPSQDVWEDTPDSALHTTEVDPEPEEGEEEDAEQDTGDVAGAVPSIPARPNRAQASGDADGSGTDRQAPSIPSRPKPQVPSRPARAAGDEANGEAPLSKTPSAERAKPAVPARPVGGKIAQLQAGFMSDLNNRLKLGPQAPKQQEAARDAEEEQAEKAPLADARKGRAKGPSRRKPGVSPSGAGEEQDIPPPAKPTVRFSLAASWTIFEIDEDDIVVPQRAAPVSRGPPAEVNDAVEAKAADLEPVSKETEEAGAASSSEATTQTGQIDIGISDSTQKEGEAKNLTAYLGGRASEPGSVLVDHEGREHVSADDTLAPRVEKTGHGM